MTRLNLTADDQVISAYARYDQLFPDGDPLAIAAARVALCQALVEVGEVLAPQVRAQMVRDQTALLPNAPTIS